MLALMQLSANASMVSIAQFDIDTVKVVKDNAGVFFCFFFKSISPHSLA